MFEVSPSGLCTRTPDGVVTNAWRFEDVLSVGLEGGVITLVLAASGVCGCGAKTALLFSPPDSDAPKASTLLAAIRTRLSREPSCLLSDGGASRKRTRVEPEVDPTG
jgi:hypothetical protein